MKVFDRNTITPVRYINRVGSAAVMGSNQAPKQADRVSLSNEVVAKQRLDAARAEAIKEAIAEGRYKVDLEKLARSFVDKVMQ